MSEITVTTPPGVAGPADVEVTNLDGQSGVFPDGFEYIAPAPVIASVSPGNGPVAGGTEIVVAGENFEPGAVVTVGGIVASPVGPNPGPGPNPPLLGPWPDNEPAGLSAVFSGSVPGREGTIIDGSDLFFDYTSQGGGDIGAGFNFGTKWNDPNRFLLTALAGSRYATVMRKNMLIGDTHGWNGLAGITNFAANYEALYFRMIFKYSDNWQFNEGGEKLWYLGEADGSASSFYPGLAGGGNLQFRAQGQNGPGGIWRSNSVTLPVGEWHTIELYMVAQSALGVADGSFQMWLDGVEITDFSLLSGAPEQNVVEWYNSDHTSRLFSGLQFPLYWGGQGPPKTVDDHLDISEFYITGVPAIN